MDLIKLGYKSSEIPAKTTHYWSNGTGRDTYVLENSGGLLLPQPKKDPIVLGIISITVS